MRTVATIPHAQCMISIFSYNEKWIIEIEGGQYKQSFKISHESLPNVEDVKKLVTEDLLKGTIERFRSMHADFGIAYQSLQQTKK